MAFTTMGSIDQDQIAIQPGSGMLCAAWSLIYTGNKATTVMEDTLALSLPNE